MASPVINCLSMIRFILWLRVQAGSNEGKALKPQRHTDGPRYDSQRKGTNNDDFSACTRTTTSSVSIRDIIFFFSFFSFFFLLFFLSFFLLFSSSFFYFFFFYFSISSSSIRRGAAVCFEILFSAYCAGASAHIYTR